MRRIGYALSFMLVLCCIAGPARAEEELIIVKYGKLTVTSELPDAKVFVDDTYQGRADTVIENIIVGEHTIACRTDSRSVTGKFTIRKDELLKLEADFDGGKLAVAVEREKPEPEKKEKVAEAPKPQPVPQVKPLAPKPQPAPKKVVVAEAKREEKKNPVEERRSLHLNVIKLFFEPGDNGDVRITNRLNQKVIGKYAEKKNGGGKYYRTKQNVLLCETGPCEETMAASFVYTDETGAGDTFALTWKQTVFNGITPSGTSRRDLLFCLNGACQNLTDKDAGDSAVTASAGRYRLVWSRSSLVIRRADIEKEIIDAGGSVDAY